MSHARPGPRALFFGAVGTLAETSDLQRRAFNAAFAEAGLDWHWQPEAYRALLRTPGGTRRIAEAAQRAGIAVDAEALHRRKVAHFRDIVRSRGLAPRPGLLATLERARARGLCVGWVTTTGRETIELILDGLGDAISAASFDFILDAGDVSKPKPAPDVYDLACARAGIAAEAALAIEDTPESAAAAISAGIHTVAMPGWAARDRAFPETVRVMPELSPDLLG